MRYTRYEYKRYSKLKFLCSVIIIGGISIGGGLYISSLIFDRNQENSVQTTASKNNDKDKVVDTNMNIIALQCGYYSKKENAEKSVNELAAYCTPFIIESDGKFRVMAGIYEENNASKKFDELISKGIEVAKIKLTINGENNEDKKCIEVMDGVFTILNKLDEDGVKSIKTADFKKWTQNIINKEDLNNSKKLNLINECINNFPEEINKNNKGEISANVYKAINEN